MRRAVVGSVVVVVAIVALCVAYALALSRANDSARARARVDATLCVARCVDVPRRRWCRSMRDLRRPRYFRRLLLQGVYYIGERRK